jgi:hypothetical protein
MFTHSAPFIGLLVKYVMADSDYTPEGVYGGKAPVAGAQTSPRVRPAIVVDTFGNETYDDPAKWTVNLVVFVDGMNDGYPSGTLWKSSVPHIEPTDPKLPLQGGSWHFQDKG